MRRKRKREETNNVDVDAIINNMQFICNEPQAISLNDKR